MTKAKCWDCKFLGKHWDTKEDWCKKLKVLLPNGYAMRFYSENCEVKNEKKI
jgi:hypothetical protein